MYVINLVQLPTWFDQMSFERKVKDGYLGCALIKNKKIKIILIDEKK